MTKELIKTRKIDNGLYNFFLNKPSYLGETGCCGIEIEPYITIETPENCFGYNDTLLYDNRNGVLYTLHRYLPKWIKNQLLKTYLILSKKYL